VENTDSPADRVAETVSAGAAGSALALALTRLNKGERDVILLIAWGQLSYNETAEALGTPIGTVRSRLSRARQKMRSALPPEVAHGL
jgi:RNA polymerase sigma-70 factor (ECF subfamily)